MKTIKSFITVLLLAAATIAMAVEKPKANVHPVNANQFLVAVETPQASEMEVTINDDLGAIVYYKQTNKPIASYKKIFDVKNLENGEYSIELKTNGLVSKRELVIDENNIFVGKADNAALEQPFFGLENETLVLTHLNFEKEKYRLSIFDDEGLVYESPVEAVTPINAGFDISKLKTGNYEVVLNSDSREFSYSFSR